MVSKQQKLTPWFVNGDMPARPGVYNVSCQKIGQSGKWWAEWNGFYWSDWSDEFSDVGGSSKFYWGPQHIASWRGLAADPKGKP